LRDKLSRGWLTDVKTDARRLFDSEAAVELMSTKVSEKEKSKIDLLSKGELKKLIGRSPDAADALALAAIPAYSTVDMGNIRAAQVRNNPFNRTGRSFGQAGGFI
jgi:hypothetical protein